MVNITIPPEAIEAAARAVAAEVRHDWDTAGKFQDKWRAVARAACLAMLEAWPGMVCAEEDYLGPACIILPLTENHNDKA